MGTALLAAATIGVLATAVLVVSTFRLRSTISFVLGVFAVGWTLVVVETMLLSVFRSWTRGWLLAAVYVGLALALAAWHKTGRPRPPAFTPALRATQAALGESMLAFLAAGVAVAYAYLLVVALAIPPIDPDVLAYHLPRIVLWIQQQAVAAIPNAPGPDLDAHPPAAEIAQSLGPLFAQTDRYVSIFQLTCAPVAALAVTGIARRLGLTVPRALFGGLVFAAFPIVALQAPTAANDLALATPVVLAAHFGLGRSRAELALMALSVGLALSTKVSAALALSALAVFLGLVLPVRRLPAVALAGVAGCALGSWWYLANLSRTGAWDGGLASVYDQVPSRAPADILLRLCRYLLQSIELTGAVGRDRLLFPIAGGVLLVVVLVATRRRGTVRYALVVAGLLVAGMPWLVSGAHEAAARAIARAWIAAGRSDVLSDIALEAAARPSPGEAWFGPAFALLLTASLVAIVWRPGVLERKPLLVAAVAAPAALYVANAAAFVWEPGRGRFFIVAAALAASTFGTVLGFRAVSWAACWVVLLALGLSLVHFRARPLGITLFEPRREATLWTAPRWQANSAFSADVPAVVETQRLGEAALEGAHTIAVRAAAFTPIYIVFGSGPWRRVLFVGDDDVVPPEADHLVVFGSTAWVDAAAWKRVPGPTTWALYRRSAGTAG
jgi:hypothetical protein